MTQQIVFAVTLHVREEKSGHEDAFIHVRKRLLDRDNL